MVNVIFSLKALLHRLWRPPMADNSTLRALIHFATHAPNDLHLPRDPKPIDVVDFERMFVEACRRDVIDRHRDILTQCAVRSVRLYKHQRGVEHEYIVVDVVVPAVDDTPERFIGSLKCERTVAPEHSRTTNHSGAFSPASSSSGLAIPAVDQFFVWDPPMETRIPADHRLAYTHDFPPAQRPPLARLIAAASALHDEAPNYVVTTHQCYWYANVLFRILVREASDQVPLQPGVSFTEGDTTRAPDVPPKTVNAGTFISVFKFVTKRTIQQAINAVDAKVEAKQVHVEAQLEEVRAQLLDLQRKAEENQRNIQQLEVERTAKEEAQRQVEAERAAKEEAHRQVEAERVAKEEAQRQVEAERATRIEQAARIAALERQLESLSPAS
ncbi:hypothetical protein BV20DRAFT_1051490 [Pilatotrama ljubarskyi]|nr:hypothetical protein BV20DRAFT_1051490 [Pilatotrama ljubarskyi]